MVEFGGKLAKKHGIKNLEYRLGDIEDPPIAKNSVDLAILSQALHHAIHPQQAVAAAHGILKRGGRLAILDLLSHRFEPARTDMQIIGLGSAKCSCTNSSKKAASGKLK